jgi:hypothetical protein
MSSNRPPESSLDVWLVVLAALGMTAWYLKYQLIYSLVFLFQLAQLIFPGRLPRIG